MCCPLLPPIQTHTVQILPNDSGKGRKNGGILHFHHFLRATDGPETHIEAQERGHSLI
jgi:hypothetical protein